MASLQPHASMGRSARSPGRDLAAERRRPMQGEMGAVRATRGGNTPRPGRRD
ncbi:MAG TPA: hypothetical protein VM286_09715 [Candidatus Thermoplasmatota archaeon]|nr:hypothetical protein [Candidatus Thermoplasmatota archaeon]